jgi:hypothetical protein
MPWRETLLRHFGPGLLGGITFGAWLKLLRDNRFAVAPSCFWRVSALFYHAAQNSVWRLLENLRYGHLIKDVQVPPPLFLLGHWRNGTTHLHNLLACDERFAFPNNYQAFFPHTFLSTEALAARVLGFFLPRRRPMDNIEWTVRSPQEDEFALCAASLKSPCLGWVFPKRREHYGRYLTFHEADAEEIKQWQEALLTFLRKLTWKYGRPLVLKSPPHTARIKLLLELFPEAKFVHIHRDPYAVFPSAKHTFEVNFELHRVQRLPPGDDVDGWILRQYREMYDAFFAQRGLIPADRFHEIGYEDLEKDPLGEVRRLYEALDLPDFAQAAPALERYLATLAGYQKNKFPELPAELRARIAEEWRRCFDEWGYAV